MIRRIPLDNEFPSRLPAGGPLRSTLFYAFLSMTVFGLLIGLIFPAYVQLILGLPEDHVATPLFRISCVVAGLLVGGFGYLIMRLTIIARWIELYRQMEHVIGNVRQYREGHLQVQDCNDCYMQIDSADRIGLLQARFNELVSNLRISFASHELTDVFYAHLNGCYEPDQLADTCVEILHQGLPQVLSVRIIGRDEEASSGVRLLAQRGSAPEISDWFSRLALRVLDSGREHYESCTAHKHACEFCQRAGCSGIELFPVGELPNLHAVLAVSLVTPWQQTERALVRRLVNIYYLAYRSAHNYRRVRDLADRDALTAAYNRRAGMAGLREVLWGARQQGQQVSLILLDLDFFKAINDSHGHQCGDEVLCHVVHLIQARIREDDLLIRYGGEEFILVLAGMGSGQAFERAERLRLDIESSPAHWDGRDIGLSASMGVASTSAQHDQSYAAEQLILRADQALYAAKEQGRNCTAVASLPAE